MSPTALTPTPAFLSSTLSALAGSPPESTATFTPERLRPIEAAVSAGLAESHSRFLHVAEQGVMVRRAGSRIIIARKDQVLLEVSSMKLQGVVIYGNAQVSTACLRNLMDEGVWLSFFTRGGTYKGKLVSPLDCGGKLRAKQWECARDPEACLAFARSVVRGKVLGQRLVATAYAKNYLAETLGEGYRTIVDTLARLESVKDLEELRGVEGTASRAYFGLFRRWNRSEFLFNGREKRGATDPINVLLNFGYTLVTRELDGLIESAGLDPTVGFYHQLDGDRPSLACDWVEEFRHPFVDRLVLKLINNGVIKQTDFDARNEKGLRLAPDGLRKFIAAYEKALIGVPAKNGEEEGVEPTAFRAIFLRQLARILDFLSARTPYKTWVDC